MPHIFPIQIRFNDIDMVGHVNNVVYGHYCDLARITFMNEIFQGAFDLQQGDRILILVHTDFDFCKPTVFGDRLHVESRVLRVGQRSLQLEHKVVDEEGVLRASSRCVLSTYDRSTGTSFPLPSEWRDLFTQYLEA